MKMNLILGIVAAIVGLVSGPSVTDAIVNRFADIGWFTIVVMFLLAALVPPATLVLLSMSERYIAMARSWSVFFFIAVFLIAAAASSLALSAGADWTSPSSYLLFAWGFGLLSILSLIKLWLLRIGAKKAARDQAAGTAEEEAP